MDLVKNLIHDDKTIQVEHPELDGLVVVIRYMSTEATKKLLTKATTTKLSRRTHMPEDKIDNDLFLKLWSDMAIKNWMGFKYSYLAEFIPIDYSKLEVDVDAELEYSKESAETLMKKSQEFDNWLSGIINDVRNFNKSN